MLTGMGRDTRNFFQEECVEVYFDLSDVSGEF